MNGMEGLTLFGISMFSWGLGRVSIPFGITFLRRHGVIRKNYLGDDIPTGYGLVLLCTFTMVYVALSPLYVLCPLCIGEPSHFWAIGAASLWIVLWGWVDDTLGDHQTKGFRGHFATLKYKGVLTTGLLKAVGGGAAAFAVAAVTANGLIEWLLHGLLIGLATNWLNLLDLRPGRAVKFYLPVSGILLLIAWPQPFVFLFLPLIVLSAATLKTELAGHVMLGDSGANLLGMQLGILTALTWPPIALAVAVLLLVAGHVYAERHSLTELIERVSWLKRLDSWGRAKQ